MRTPSTLLALCEGNRESTGHRRILLTKGRMLWSFAISSNKLSQKQSSCRWLEMPWRSCNVTVMDRDAHLQLRRIPVHNNDVSLFRLITKTPPKLHIMNSPLNLRPLICPRGIFIILEKCLPDPFNELCCARSRYQEQGQAITSQRYCGM